MQGQGARLSDDRQESRALFYRITLPPTKIFHIFFRPKIGYVPTDYSAGSNIDAGFSLG